MFFGSLESQQKPLQDHAEKNHSPLSEEEVTRREFDLSKKDKPEKTPTSKTQQDVHMKSVFDELELGMEMNTSSKFTHG